MLSAPSRRSTVSRLMPGRWHGCYASHDPVPGGPIQDDAMLARESRILNTRFALRDHTTYFQNMEGFVAPGALDLFGLTGVGARTSAAAPALASAAAQRDVHTWWRRVLRLAAVFASIAIVAYAAPRNPAARAIEWSNPASAAWASADGVAAWGAPLGSGVAGRIALDLWPAWVLAFTCFTLRPAWSAWWSERSRATLFADLSGVLGSDGIDATMQPDATAARRRTAPYLVSRVGSSPSVSARARPFATASAGPVVTLSTKVRPQPPGETTMASSTSWISALCTGARHRLDAFVAARGNSWIRALLVAAALGSAAATTEAGSMPTHMRAVHAGGNWGGNYLSIERANPGPLAAATTIAAASAVASVTRSSYVDATGTTVFADGAVIGLGDVHLGTGAHFERAGFWVVRHVNDGATFIQFRPSLDPSLAGIPGFAGDVTFGLSADGKGIDVKPLRQLTGPAAEYVAAVLAHAPELLANAAFAVKPPATLDRAAVVEAMERARAAMTRDLGEYFDYLASLNVQWIGVSVAIFYESIADPTVRVKYEPRPAPATWTIFTFDDATLGNFIAQARERGFRIYLTLSFEAPTTESPADPTCRTERFLFPRWLLGDPGTMLTPCVDPSLWWWDPSHPKFTANAAQFWSSYTAVAVKYAQLAQQWGVELYSLGTETDQLFRTRPGTGAHARPFGSELKSMVAAVRAVYSGLVTYDQHFSVMEWPAMYGGAQTTDHLFADLGLDVVGISSYFPLIDTRPARVLSTAEIELLWEELYRRHFLPLKERNPGKPIALTEMGFFDDLSTLDQPGAPSFWPITGRDASGVTNGMRQQHNAFEAFFNVNERHDDLVAGAFVWDTFIFVDQVDWLCSHVSHNVYCKPAQEAIRNAYARQRAIEQVAAVEYHHEGFDHYFLTALPDEIAKLDAGTFAGWSRTGEAIQVFHAAVDGSDPVCRFFSAAFAPKSSHFYTADAGECAKVKANADWTFEGSVFRLARPDAAGGCPSGTRPVYRLYNDGRSGAPNHRYTASVGTRDRTRGWGWVSEGYGATGVIMCAPT